MIQVMMSMAIGSVVITAAVPKVKQSERQSRANIIVADMRTFATAFEAYAQERGAWPDEVSAGVMPAEMADRLGPTSWLRVSPIGGQYNWENDQLHGGIRYKAVLSVSETSTAQLEVNEQLLTEIDALMDDGNLSTGQFRVGVNFDPIYILQR